jgi:hypothetical protein
MSDTSDYRPLRPPPEPRRVAIVLWVLAALGGLLIFFAMNGRAHADGYIVSCDLSVGVTCFAGPMVNPYVRQVPQPTSEAGKEEQRRLDMVWVHECAPELVRDRYGVLRYHYNDPGCAFGSHP